MTIRTMRTGGVPAVLRAFTAGGHLKTLLLTALLLLPRPSFAQSDDCTGIVPGYLGLSVNVSKTHSSGDLCSSATSDESGNVAIESHEPFRNATSAYDIFASDGTFRGSLSLASASRDLIPQYLGFESTWRDPRAFGSTFAVRDDADGTELNRVLVSGSECEFSLYRSSETGAISLRRCFAPPGASFGGTLFQSLDTDGNVTGLSKISSGTEAAVAVGDQNGMNLVTFWPGTQFGFGADDFVGRWYDDQGNPVSDAFYIATGAAGSARQMNLRSLIGGGAALQVNADWIASFPSGVASVQAPPQFLAEHPGWDFDIVRGRLAYALVSRNGDEFASHMPLYSAAGNRCGAVDFPAVVTSLTVGADGTVIGSSGADGCSDTFWPALLSAP